MLAVSSNLLEAFVVAARQDSFKRASAHLCLCTSSLSDRIRDLETELGFRLFNRTTRRLQLTRHGREFLADAEKTLCANDEMQAAAKRISHSASKQLVIGSGPYGGAIRRLIVNRFVKRHPEIDVQIMIDVNQTKLFDLLRSGDIDFVLGWGKGSQRLESCCAHGVEVGLIIPNATTLPDKAVLRTADLRGSKLISCSDHLGRDGHRALKHLAEANDIEVIESCGDRGAENLAYVQKNGMILAGCAEFGTPDWPVEGLSYRRWEDFTKSARFRLYRDPFSASFLARKFWNEVRLSPSQAA